MLVSQQNALRGAALFFLFFSLQFLFFPELLMATNFQQGSYTLDKWHLFLMRGFGVLGFFFCGVLWQLASTRASAAAWIGYFTSFMCVFSAVMPFWAHLYLPVRMPQHLLPVVGAAVLCLLHLLAFFAPAEGPKAKSGIVGLFGPVFAYHLSAVGGSSGGSSGASSKKGGMKRSQSRASSTPRSMKKKSA